MFGAITPRDAKIRFGELVRQLRKREGLTQQELGERLRLSRMTIQNLESGRNGTMDTMLIVMQHFDLLNNFYNEIGTQIANSSYDSLY